MARRTLVALCAASLVAAASAFAPGGAAALVRGPARAHVSPLALRMSGKGGFGKPGKGGTPVNKPAKSKLSTERKDAAARYDTLKEGGAPEFNVYVRLKGGQDRDQEEGVIAGGWYPVGSMSCPSSTVINKAVWDSHDAILQGAFRANEKIMRRSVKTLEGKTVGKWQDLKGCDIEYGYLLKEFADEDITVASEPEAPGVAGMMGGFFQKITDAANWVPDNK